MYDRVDGSGEVQMSIEQKKLDYLMQTETNHKSHSGITLIDHLVGVHDILKEWEAPQYLQDAGLFHSIYGTSVFEHQSTNDRNTIRELIGEQAEELVYQFSTLIQPRLNSIRGLDDGQLKKDLQLLWEANELEQRDRIKAPMMSWKEAYDL